MKNNDFDSQDLDFDTAAEVAVSEGEPTESGGPHDLDFDVAAEVAISEGERTESGTPDLGDLVIVLLASTLAGVRDRLDQDGFDRASELVAELTVLCDRFLLSQSGAGPR